MPKTRAIRIPDEEDKRIEQFLSLNPFFDFSSLARTSILKFIENPQLDIKAVAIKKRQKRAPRSKETTR